MENPYSLKKKKIIMADFLQKKKKAKAFAIQNTDFFFFNFTKGILLARTILQIHFNENL